MIQRQIEIEKRELSHPGDWGYTATWKKGYMDDFSEIFATVSATLIEGHYIISRYHGPTDFGPVGRNFGTPETRGQKIKELEEAFGIEHDPNVADQRIRNKLINMIKRREGRRVNTEIIDLIGEQSKTSSIKAS